jgi:hypothetical protein
MADKKCEKETNKYNPLPESVVTYKDCDSTKKENKNGPQHINTYTKTVTEKQLLKK